ncbi:MAG: hypothetical protein M3360_11175 [Actinomycetota bacterium]|nr:hypothetical protein [Actinomycetota bacterium]
MDPINSTRRQIAFMVLGWMAFFGGWSLVLSTVTARTISTTLVFIFCSLAVNVALVIFWITHNVRLFALKGPRKGVSSLPFDAESDFLGRTLVADWDRLLTTDRVAVTVEGNSKRFSASRPGPGLVVVADPGQIEPVI